MFLAYVKIFLLWRGRMQYLTQFIISSKPVHQDHCLSSIFTFPFAMNIELEYFFEISEQILISNSFHQQLLKIYLQSCRFSLADYKIEPKWFQVLNRLVEKYYVLKSDSEEYCKCAGKAGYIGIFLTRFIKIPQGLLTNKDQWGEHIRWISPGYPEWKTCNQDLFESLTKILSL